MPPSARFIEFRKEEIEQSIPSRFEQIVETYPDQLAVKTQHQELTYEALNQESNRVANLILDRCGDGEKSVALLFEQGAPIISAILGVLKAGKIYVPLDPSLPKKRIAYMLEDSRAGLLLTNTNNLASANELAHDNLSLLNVDEAPSSLSATNPGLAIPPEAVSAIVYTSGSTGMPKGVIKTHLHTLHKVMNLTNTYYLNPDDHFSLLYSCSAHGSERDVFGSLLNGATLFPFSVKEEGAEKLAEWLENEEITIYHSVASVFRHLTNILEGDGLFPKLRFLLVGGESVNSSDVERYRNFFPPNCSFVNGLGCGEVGSFSRYIIDQKTPLSGTNVPVGFSFPDKEVLLLDEAGQEVGPNEVGEIVVKSRFLSPGYWGKPDLTKESFLPDPDGGQERLYLTKDMGMKRPDGCLIHMGRKSFRAMVRGYSVELPEIERVLHQIESIKEAAILGIEDSSGSQRLVAYFVPRETPAPTSRDLRDALEKTLPSYMIPSAFIQLDKFPMTPSGKIDRQALPRPGTARPDIGIPFAPPRNQMEEELVKIWADVLGIDKVGIHDPFLELGGDSLRVSQLISRVLKVFRTELSMQILLNKTTVADMAEAIASHQTEGANGNNGTLGSTDQSIPQRKGTGPAPLSFSQERLWFLDQFEPQNSSYNMPNAFRLKGPLDQKALEKALQTIVDRHAVIRTTFESLDDGPVQVVHPNRRIKLNIVDLGENPDGQGEEKIKHLLRTQIQRPFDLSRDLMIRTTLLRLGDEDHVFLLVKHHIASDGWSSRIFAREMSELYNAYSRGDSPSLPELPIQYADFAEWQRNWLQGEVLEQQVAYWRDRLAGSPDLLPLPTDRARPTRQTFRGAQKEFHLSKDLVASLQSLSRQEGVTLFMTLLSGFQTLLYRYTGSEDISVGTPVANRTRVETEGLIGFFMNILVLRTDLSKKPTFRQLLERVQDVCLGAYAHQDLPFEKLVAELQPKRSLSHSPFFQVMFNYQSAPSKGPEFAGLTADVIDMETGGAKFDLYFSLRGIEGAIKYIVEYNTDLFDEATISQIHRHYQHLLEVVAKEPDRQIASILLTPSGKGNQQTLPDPTTQTYQKDKVEHLLAEIEGLSDEEASLRLTQMDE